MNGTKGAALIVVSIGFVSTVGAQETDITQTPNAANAGIKKSLSQQIGAGRGDIVTPNSSAFIIARDPFRAIARGRQLFQRKFTLSQGSGPRTGDGVGDIETDLSHGAGLADSCAACHGRPQGSAGFGGDVFTRPSSRDAPHLFGLGLQEMLADEITQELRGIQTQAISDAIGAGSSVVAPLNSKGIHYGFITAHSNGAVDTSAVEGVDSDLRVRPFFAEGTTISMREFIVGAFNAEMGLESPDPDLLTASGGGMVVTPGGMVLDGSTDSIEGTPASGIFDDPDLDGVVNEIPQSLVDFVEFYLLNYFKPGVRLAEDTHPFVIDDPIAGGDPFNSNPSQSRGRRTFEQIGCTECHIPDLTIDVDRRVADVETVLNEADGNPYNNLLATATPLLSGVDDMSGHPTLKVPLGNSFDVEDFFADMKRHDLGPNFWEKNFDGTLQKEFITEPLWGVGSTAPYGHDGRSPTLVDVILRHGGEAQEASNRFRSLNRRKRADVVEFLQTLIIFSPPSTASNLNGIDPMAPDYPVNGHGSIALSVLFNEPLDKE